MGLINTIGNKIRNGYLWLKEKISAIAENIQKWVNRYNAQREAIKRHHEYINEILDSEMAYEPEAIDINLRNRLKKILGNMESGNIEDHLISLPFEKRKEYFEQVLLPLVAKEMNIKFNFLGWFQSECTAGFYNEEKTGIALNEIFLACDNKYILGEMINTVIHECKHAMQWDAISGRNTHGYSLELIEKWKINTFDYITPEENDEAYVKQPIEWDASSFAESVYCTDKNL